MLPIEIQGLMGEANLAYARGETNKAIDICIEVIRIDFKIQNFGFKMWLFY